MAESHTKFLRMPEVKLRAGLSKPSIYRLIKAGQFPRPKKLSKQSVGWDEREIQAWCDSRRETQAA